MARLGKRDAEQSADELADKLDEMSAAAKETSAGENNDGAVSINAVIREKLNIPAARALGGILEQATEIARRAPTIKDEGAGDGPLHPDFLIRMAERGYPANGATGVDLVVDVVVNEDEQDTLKVRLLEPPAERD